MLDPDAVAGRTFGTSFRGYDTEQVRRFLVEVAHELRALAGGALEGMTDEQATTLLGEEAGRLLGAARSAAGEVEAKAAQRAADVLREAQEEALRLRSTVDAERERAYAEGAARADEVLAEAQQSKEAIEVAARAEADALVAEAVAAREHVLSDLARRRKSVRAQVEQLHAARQKLLEALADVGRAVEEARGRLVVALPEAKLAADAAARRAQDEPEATIEQLESELEAFRLAGLALGAAGAEANGERDTAAEVEPADSVDAPAEAAEPGDEREGRRSTSVRVFRTRREAVPALGLAAAELHEVEPPDPVEEVRVVEEVEEEVEEVEGVAVEEPAPAPAPAPAAEGEAGLDSGAVDALFARLRAGREERTAAAEAVLAAPEIAETSDVSVADALEAEPEPEAADASAAAGDDRSALLARRDELLAAPAASLLRRSKRLLADEQNAVLDALRRLGVTVDAVATRDDLEARWADEARPDLTAAAAGGTDFLGGTGFDEPALDDIATDFATAVAGSLHERIVAAVERADTDLDLAADSVRAVCREWRSQRLGDAVDHAVRAAFGRGALAAADASGGRVCWVVDDGGSPCPDAEDNALAGSLPAGDPFPTGHRHPPAHPGCRCVLASSP